MRDINLIREHPEQVREALQRRTMDTAPVHQIVTMDNERKELIKQTETLKAERNTVSKEISQMKDPAQRQAKIDAMRSVGDKIAVLDERLRRVDSDLQNVLAMIPNIPHPQVPYGQSDQDNVVKETFGELPSSTSSLIPIGIWDPRPASSTSSRASRSPARASTCSTAPGPASSAP